MHFSSQRKRVEHQLGNLHAGDFPHGISVDMELIRIEIHKLLRLFDMVSLVVEYDELAVFFEGTVDDTLDKDGFNVGLFWKGVVKSVGGEQNGKLLFPHDLWALLHPLIERGGEERFDFIQLDDIFFFCGQETLL